MPDALPRTLPQAPWTERADLAALVEAIGPANLCWVGGAVRDTLLGDAVNDVDAATPLTPDAVIDRFLANPETHRQPVRLGDVRPSAEVADVLVGMLDA